MTHICYLFHILRTFPFETSFFFEEGIFGTPVQKDDVPSMVISNDHRWKTYPTKTDLCIELSLFTSH